ncbi:MAG: alpha/beta hydrolase [Caulobacteraceae bacterium]|nr:alpha/beta hydrolase [Caulobacteraceae bacterium]
MADATPLLDDPLRPDGGAAAWVTGADGARLRAAFFPAQGAARGGVVVSPGRTEPIEKYYEVVGDLTRRGFAVVVHDWRGQGLSHRMLPDRLLGHASGHADFLADYRALLDACETRLPRPWIGLGHSMGGCLTLLALAEGETRLAGAILSAPMLGLSLGRIPLPVARALAGIATRLGLAGRAAMGRGGEAAPFEGNILTHDRARYDWAVAQTTRSPDLALGGPTWGWIDFALAATARLRRGEGTPRIAVPVVIVAAGEERLVDNAGARAVAARLAHGRYLEAPGAYHEILQETDDRREPFWRAFDELAGEVTPRPL